MEKSLKSLAINYGVYVGLILSAVTIIAYVIDLTLLTKWWLGIILFVVIIVFGIVSTAKAKSVLQGFISFKQAFSSFFITVAIGILLSTVVNIILFNFIDPEAAEIIKQATIEASVSMMEGFGAPQDAIDQTISQMENTNQFAIDSLLKSLAWQFLFYSIVGLIVAAFMKKKDPNAE
jgi:hypothetical protein